MTTQKLQNVKIQHFKQVAYELYRWWIEENSDKENDLNITKVMKLLFFVSGVDSENHLFNVFNKFQAWQYGHVEADIYSFYSEKDGDFGNFTIDRNRLVFKDEHPLESDSFSEKIKNNIQILKDENHED